MKLKLCNLIGHKVNILKGNVYDDKTCERSGCKEIVKGLSLPTMPKCKKPKDNVILGGFASEQYL